MMYLRWAVLAAFLFPGFIQSCGDVDFIGDNDLVLGKRQPLPQTEADRPPPANQVSRPDPASDDDDVHIDDEDGVDEDGNICLKAPADNDPAQMPSQHPSQMKPKRQGLELCRHRQ